MKQKLQKEPLVEIVGQNRVLVENHMGVLAYSLEKIQVKVVYGKLVVSGMQLHLMQLCGEQLVITGNIHSVELVGREQ